MHLWWGGGGDEQVHNVDYDPVKTVGGEVNRRRFLHHKSPDGTDTSSVMWAGGQISPTPNLPQPVEISITTQHNSMGPTQQYGPWIHLIYIYIKLPIDSWFLWPCA